MTAKVSKKNSFSTLSYQVLWLGSGIRPPRTIPLGPEIEELCGYGATEEEAVADFLEIVAGIGDQFEDANGEKVDWDNVELVYSRLNC